MNRERHHTFAKKLLALCAAAFLLSACINVDDFGEAWDKATVDPVLQGRWRKLSEEDNRPTGQEWTFTVKDGAYEIQSYKNGVKDDDGPLYPVKTITVGRYKFLANGPEQGAILRYTTVNDKAVWYVLNSKAAWAFIQKNFPGTDSIYREESDDSSNPGDSGEQPLRIRQFDDDVYKILAAIPDTEIYWDPDTETEKVK